MAEQVLNSMQVSCHGCHAQFRLTPRRTSVAITELPCPVCRAIISVPPYPLVRNPADKTLHLKENRREETRHEELVSSVMLPASEEQGWTRVRLGAMFNRPDEAPPAPERPVPSAEPTSLQNRFRPVATDENIGSDAATTISNLGVFGQIAQKEHSARPVVFEEPPESVDSFAIPSPAPAAELVRNAKRLPETDKPDDVHPLAAVLLKQLRDKRSQVPASRTIAAVAPAPEHRSTESTDLGTAETDFDTDLPVAFENIFDDVFKLDTAFDSEQESESVSILMSSAPSIPSMIADLAPEIIAPIKEPAKRVEPNFQAIDIIDALQESESISDKASTTAMIADLASEIIAPVKELAKHIESTAPPIEMRKTPPERSVTQPEPSASHVSVRGAQISSSSAREVISSELELPSESALRGQTEVEVEVAVRWPQPRLALFGSLLIVTAVASALAVHVYHSKTVPVVEEVQAPVVFAIREPVDVDLSKFRSLWSAIAVASETVNSSTKQTARQKILGLIESGMSERAQHMILEQVTKYGLTPESQALFDMNLRADPRLDYSLITIVPNADASVIVDSDDERERNITSIDELRALGGGHSVSFRLTRGGENLYAFKPDQRVWQGGWRTEIAAYNLCFIMICHFSVPENRPARISRSDFETMYGQINTDKQRKYAERFDELIWESEANADGSVTEYLYGTLKEWIPQFVLWPIEYEDIWQPWVNHTADPALLDVPFSDAIGALKSRPNSSFYSGILREQSGATTRSLARQVSTLLVFDYLTNNHDRFSLVEDYYGVNNHFVGGKFMSIDNGAAFQFQAMQKIQTRFEPVTRFSRSTIESLRLMRPEAVSEILFPDAVSAEKLRLDVFWQQRKRLLERVDALIKEHGESQILYFD